MTEAAPVGRRERNKQQTRDRLLTAARELLAIDPAAATVESIAERAEVSRATFFNYFPSKDDLLTALYADLMGSFSHVVDALLAKPLSTYERVLGMFVDFGQSSAADPEYMRVVTGEIERISSMSGTLGERSHLFTSQVLRLIERGLQQNDVRTDHPPAFLAQMVAAIYVSSMRYWQIDPDFEVGESFERAGRYAAESLLPR
ncbi:TetR family transcriptional regulator [Gordonia jinghuaiqii]|uniref:TetR/AcrR family transcriptional regulator n=1 Tax=Gordonia jinghuaiqii TaxID=2758710 RepID=A0A7D7QUE2_9ACTN|nr:TetR/AcrR family transcriptional regulator [Gordonia jinghuaiqii]MCR5976579.1 TetR family transcriptional regulator [Gordonia jinghuaiqii]QMS99768.1 TetR/AcrR family transcriptional regulator [Gordonia jinghuaiqii]